MTGWMTDLIACLEAGKGDEDEAEAVAVVNFHDSLPLKWLKGSTSL